jgi:membrane protease YdiL (CAAX protease family)
MGGLVLSLQVGLLVDAVETAWTTGRLAISIVLIGFLWRLRWGAGAGLKPPQAHWLLAMVPMSLGALALLAGSDWQSITLDKSRFVPWLTHKLVAGIFEEILFRGAFFYILFRAWGHTRNGVFGAALVSSLIFGPMHLLSLVQVGIDSGQVIAGVAQAFYATLFGVGFVGLVVYTRSLLPSIAIHALINASGSVGRFFGSAPVDDAQGASGGLGQIIGYAVVIIVIFMISTLPGLLYLRGCELFPRRLLDRVRK